MRYFVTIRVSALTIVAVILAVIGVVHHRSHVALLGCLGGALVFFLLAHWQSHNAMHGY